jgi:glycerophosphoryl diester phosphodiesterase
MATTNLGRVRFNMRGDYNPDADPLYSLFDLVSDGGGSFVYINDTPSNEPTSSTSQWQQIASVGGQDILDAVTAEKNAAIAAKVLAEGYAAQLAAGIASPAGTYANLAALNAGTPTAPNIAKIYLTIDDGKWCYYNGTAWVSGGVYQATVLETDKTLTVSGAVADAKVTGDKVGELKSAFNSLSNITTNQKINWVDDFGMSLSLFNLSSGNLVSDTYKNGYRVASNYSDPPYLEAGSYFTIPSDRRLYVYYSADKTGGSWVDKSGTWITTKYVIPTTGYYAFVISSIPSDSVSVANVKTFLEDVAFFVPLTNSSITGKVSELENNIYGYENWKNSVQYGTVVVDQNGWSNSNYASASRICINVNGPIQLAKGDIIKVPYGYAMYIAYRKNNAYYYTGEWTVADYFCPDSAEYVFTMRTFDNSPFTQSTLAEIANTISIISANNLLQYEAAVSSGNDFPIKTIARLGYNISSSATPPEQSIASYKEAYKRGYRYMLCDVRWTIDHVPVALHDATINSVARNIDGTPISSEIEISNITLSQVDDYDFGIIKGSAYAGTKIMRVVDFLEWCILNRCHPILEIKTDNADLSADNTESLLDIINAYNMGNDCIFVVDRQSVGEMVHTNYPKATIGVAFSDGLSISTVFGYAAQLQGDNDVFIYVYAKESFTYLISQTLADAAAEYKVSLGLTECKSEAELEDFLANSLNLSVKWLAIRDMPFYEYIGRRNL